jgi:hypothetical protein
MLQDSPRGAAIATGRQETQLDVFLVDRNGGVAVAWLPDGRPGWSVAAMAGVGLAPPGGSLAAMRQSDHVLDVLITGYGALLGRFAVASGGWSGPFALF